MEESTLSQDSLVPAEPTSDREVQRAILRDLVSLATDCAATESEIERKFRFESESENGRHERLIRDTTRKYAALREGARQQHDTSLTRAENAFQAAFESLKLRDEEIRRKIDGKYQQMVQDVMKNQDQAIWLADSVLENEQNGAAVDFKKAKETIEQHRKEIESWDVKGRQLLADYAVTVPDPTPAELEKERASAPKPSEAATVYLAQRELAEKQYHHLANLRLPRLFVGSSPYLAVIVPTALAALAPQFIWPAPGILQYAAVVGGTLIAVIVAGFVLRKAARKHVRDTYLPFRAALGLARRATAGESAHALAVREHRLYEAHKKRKEEVQAAKEKYEPFLNEAARKRDGAIESLQADYNQRLGDLKVTRDKAWSDAEELEKAQLADVQQRADRELGKANDRHELFASTIKARYDESVAALTNRLHAGLSRIRVPHGAIERCPIDWNDPIWEHFKPATRFPEQVRFGEMTIDLRQIASAGVPRQAAPAIQALSDHTEYTENFDEEDEAVVEEKTDSFLNLELPPPFTVPATLVFPRLGSMLIQCDRETRPQAIRLMQNLMARLLTTLPPGRVRFTLIDPIGRGENFAGFMHLADHDEALVGGRIWTEQDQIEQRLADMTEHMETVIQKYLRNEYETIDAYNAQAGELAEPYRYLIVADFPTGFETDAARRLASVASSGPRCGVYTIVLRDLRQPLPTGALIDELESNSVNIVQEGQALVVRDDVFGQFPLALDAPPSEPILMQLLDVIGGAAKAAKRVELPFDSIAPREGEIWSQSSADELAVPVGRSGATKLQYLRLGRGVAQHVLIAGKTGSGKSTLLHAMVTNLAMWYSPDEVEFYLVDFKKGVEFKTYATHNLPHARAIAVESDREFGLSVLQRLDAELTRRGNLYRKAGTQDLAAYRQSAGAMRMPRTLLMIDEFQEFFSEDDKLAQDASLLLDRLVRQGRAFGIHVLLGSQTIGGSSGLPRSTIGQMAVRIALQTSEADSQLILGDNNSAARLLSRPGEAIYNDAGGLTENNSPFQVAWLPDPKREAYLDRVHQRAVKDGVAFREPAIVFEGNAAADVRRNARLTDLIDAAAWLANPPAVTAFMGDPVAIKDPTAVTFRRQAGNNMLIVGQQDDAALAIMATSIVSIAAQQSFRDASFYILDGTPADSPLAGTFGRLKNALPHDVNIVDYRLVPEAINEVSKILAHRQGGGNGPAPSIYIMVHGLQRYRMLRKTEEAFSFSAADADADKAPEPDKQFTTILREGPSFGIHVITWADTPATLERSLDRAALREFDNRVLFQMSANDSSNLIDSPAGNKLGPSRALIYSEELGVMEKFRPYALPDKSYLAHVRERLASRRAAKEVALAPPQPQAAPQ